VVAHLVPLPHNLAGDFRKALDIGAALEKGSGHAVIRQHA
jgi:hypothetical protein